MKLKNIKFFIFFRILLLAISLFFVAWLFFYKGNILKGIYASVIPIALVFELTFFVDRNNNQIRNYLESVEWDDFSIKMPENIRDKSYHELNKSLNSFNEKLEKLRKENFTQFYFIESLINEALVGLMVINQHEEVFFVNKAFEQITSKAKIGLLKPVKDEITDIWNQIRNLSLNEKKTIELDVNGQSKVILFQVSEFVIDNERFRLFSAQNIKFELENTELDTWKKLIRVLSHEILNSASPILSLSHTLMDLIKDNPEKDFLLKKLTEGLDVINQRSAGLMKFTNAFSTISKLPEPEKLKLNVTELIQKLEVLFKEEFDKKEIEFKFKVIPGAEFVFADQYQLEQVLINLVKNSIESFKDKAHKQIGIAAYKHNEVTRIEISDNGYGISTDKSGKVFLPFFTTKEKGNGIGLALSKQIMFNHNGDISLESEQNKGTKVILEFPIE